MSSGEGDTPVLLAKARDDAVLLRKVVGDREVADAIVGFHAQQAVEKALKVVLESRGVDYPYTHDIDRLFALLDESGGAPEGRDDALELSPWAVELRYGDVVGGPLDRDRAVAVAERILVWAEREIAPPADDAVPAS